MGETMSVVVAEKANHGSHIIAEIGFNHGGNFELAQTMLRAAAACGVNAVKFQTFRAAELVLDSAEHFNIIKDAELTEEEHRLLAATAAELSVGFLSTPFDKGSVELLDRVGVSAFKIASMDVTNLPLLRLIGSKGKPALLSTGMASLVEIAQAVEILENAGCGDITLLHCISHYPAAAADTALQTIPYLHNAFRLPVGWSDHTLGNVVALAAVALGATVVEKHFTSDKNLPGPDHALSTDPAEMKALVNDIRAVESALAKPPVLFQRKDRAMALLFRRGVYAARDIEVGECLTEEMLICVRPEAQFNPAELPLLLGRTVRCSIARNQPITGNAL
jgi:N,N'-diacetyllegionaminate synthase